jgi:hypothetical protein
VQDILSLKAELIQLKEASKGEECKQCKKPKTQLHEQLLKKLAGIRHDNIACFNAMNIKIENMSKREPFNTPHQSGLETNQATNPTVSEPVATRYSKGLNPTTSLNPADSQSKTEKAASAPEEKV